MRVDDSGCDRLLRCVHSQGINVVEAASYISGPFAGLILADLGAEVIKVEPPRGDPYRRFGPQDDDGGVIFRAGNRNKRSVADRPHHRGRTDGACMRCSTPPTC